MKKLFDIFGFKSSAGGYYFGKNNIVGAPSEAKIYAADQAADAQSNVKQSVNTVFQNPSNTVLMDSSFFPSTVKSTFTPRSTKQDDWNTYSQHITPYFHNNSHDRVLNKELRNVASNNFTFQDTDGTSYSINVKPKVIGNYSFFDNDITLYKTDTPEDLLNSITQTIPTYYYSTRYVRSGFVHPYWVDLQNRHIYFFGYFNYYINNNNSVYYLTIAILRLPFTTDAVEGTVSLGTSWEFFLPPQSTAAWVLAYTETRRIFFIGLSTSGNPLYMVDSERDSASYNSWYNGTPTINSDYSFYEHDLTTGSFTVLHTYTASTGWGSGNNYTSIANRIKLNYSPSAFEYTGTSNIWASYMPVYNTSNELSIVAILWDKDLDTFEMSPVTITFSNSETIRNHFVDQFEQIVPFVYQSNSILNLNNASICVVSMEIITDSNNQKHLSLFFKQKAEIASRFITTPETKNLATFRIDTPTTFTHEQTIFIDAFDTLFLDSNSTNLVVATPNLVETYQFDPVSFWQKQASFDGIAYSLARKSDNEFYVTYLDTENPNNLTYEGYPFSKADISGTLFKYSMSDISSTASHQTASVNQLHIIIEENLSYTAPSTQTNVLVAVKDSNNQFLSTTLTLSTNSLSAVWTDNSSKDITITTLSNDYLSINLTLTSPGLFYISGKM